MTRIYYECINDDGKPATPTQARKLGTAKYGYPSRVRAELMCPNGCSIRERHCEGSNDWSGRLVSMRCHDGMLVSFLPR